MSLFVDSSAGTPPPIEDRTSFAVMQRLGIVRVATLDSDFAVFRFGRGLRRAFEVVP